MPVAARHHDIRDRVLAAVDKAFAEPIYVVPHAKGAVDTSRPPFDMEGVLRVGGGKETNASGGYGQDWRARVAAGKAELHIDASRYTGPVIKAGDRLRAISRQHRPWFSVLRVDDRGESRLVWELAEV